MHITSLQSGEALSDLYGSVGKLVVDVGGKKMSMDLSGHFLSHEE
jgi:hypothetical protein